MKYHFEEGGMNIIEAAKLMKQGYKVRLGRWCENQYLYNHLDIIRDERDEEHELSLCEVLDQDWEEYIEESRLHTFEEAIVALKNGKTIKRNLWTTKVIERDFCDDYSVEFTIDDFEANDWIIVEKEVNYEK